MDAKCEICGVEGFFVVSRYIDFDNKVTAFLCDHCSYDPSEANAKKKKELLNKKTR